MFESTENQFRKSFSVKSMRLAATENRFSGKSFPFDQNFTLLTRNHFTLLFYLQTIFGKSAKERERATERKNPREQNTLSARERERTIDIDRDRDHRNCADRCRSRSRSRRSRSRSRSHRENVIFSGFYLCF